MDWSKFDLAKVDPEYLHGALVYKDEPRIKVQDVADNLERGKSPNALPTLTRSISAWSWVRNASSKASQLSRVLLDKNVPFQVRRHLVKHKV